jgi:hypothetical protein
MTHRDPSIPPGHPIGKQILIAGDCCRPSPPRLQ